jgi:hypothetical protein
MIYLFDSALVNDLEKSLNMPDDADAVVKVIDPEHIVGLAAQIQEDKISLPIIALERQDYSVDTDRTNFTMQHRGSQAIIDNNTNMIYHERSMPIKLSYTLTVLTSNQIDMDEIIKELLFKYTSMYFLTIQVPYEVTDVDRKIRFGVRIENPNNIEKVSGASQYVESGTLYQTSVPLLCDGAVLLHYTPEHLRRTSYEIVTE